jgi:CYTH domain-containing protein
VPDDYGKYARPERERRFLLSGIPPDAVPAHRIVDRYICGTRLRLRRMENVEDAAVVYKLAQKIRPDPHDPRLVMITNSYLDSAEYHLLTQLPADTLEKTRHRLLLDGRPVAVDVFDDGVVLLEADFETAEALAAFEPPGFVIREVTAEEEFTGAGRARLRS